MYIVLTVLVVAVIMQQLQIFDLKTRPTRIPTEIYESHYRLLRIHNHLMGHDREYFRNEMRTISHRDQQKALFRSIDEQH